VATQLLMRGVAIAAETNPAERRARPVLFLAYDAWEWDYQSKLNRRWWMVVARHEPSARPPRPFKRPSQTNRYNKNTPEEQSDVADAKQSEPCLVCQ
jgi:hypothetical protein